MKTQQEIWGDNHDKLGSLINEGKHMAGTKVYGSFVVILALAELLKRPIYSLYPDIVYNFRPLFHQKIVLSCCLHGTLIFILWTSKRLVSSSKRLLSQTTLFQLWTDHPHISVMSLGHPWLTSPNPNNHPQKDFVPVVEDRS